MAQYNQSKTWSDFRVGIVSLIAIIFLVLGVTFAGGDKGLFLQKTSRVRARLADVGGLKKGSSVTMGGMVVGRVTGIRFADDHDSKIETEMEVRSEVRDRIRTNSVPTVRTQGMLGDRYIDLSTPAEAGEVLPEGEYLTGPPATDFDKTLQEAHAVLDQTEQMLGAVNRKEGSVGQFFYDTKFYEKMVELSDALNDLVKDFKSHPKKYVKLSIF